MSWKARVAAAPIAAIVLSACGGSGGGGGTGSNGGTIVASPTVTSVSATGSTTITQGQTSQLTGRATWRDASVTDVTSTSTWNSTQMSVATVSGSGLVTGVAVGSTDITATFQNVKSAPLTVQITASPPPPPIAPHADFTVTPDAGSGATGSQCGVSQSGTSNVLRCTFDASISTPKPGITNYAWEIPVGGQTFSGASMVSLHDVTLTCGVGSFAGASGTADKPVKLTVMSPGGSNAITKTITFVKAGAC